MVMSCLLEKQEAKKDFSSSALCSVEFATVSLNDNFDGMRLDFGESLWYDFQQSFGEPMLTASCFRYFF